MLAFSAVYDLDDPSTLTEEAIRDPRVMALCDRVEIAEGLAAGDQVVVSGQNRIQNGAAVQIVDDGLHFVRKAAGQGPRRAGVDGLQPGAQRAKRA